MIGSGAAGSVFAAYLNKGGAELFLVDRYKAHMDAIAENGLIFETPDGEETLYGFNCYYSADDLDVMDYVIIMVKSTQTNEIMPSLSSCIGENTVVVSLQNGIGNDEILQKYVSKDRILYGFGTIGTVLPEPGKCVSHPESGIIMRFGAVENSQYITESGKILEKCFCDGGCTAQFETDIRPYVWKKVIANSGYNTLSSLTRIKVGPLLSDENGCKLIDMVWEEGCKVAQAVTGVDLREEMIEEFPKIKAGFAKYYPSMAQDVVIHQRQTEIDRLNGAIVHYGKELGIETPANETVVLLVKCIQSNYENQYNYTNK